MIKTRYTRKKKVRKNELLKEKKISLLNIFCFVHTHFKGTKLELYNYAYVILFLIIHIL